MRDGSGNLIELVDNFCKIVFHFIVHDMAPYD